MSFILMCREPLELLSTSPRKVKVASRERNGWTRIMSNIDNNKNFGFFKAKKEYICDLSGRRIKKGDKYYRVNLRYLGIFHFHKSCRKDDIDDFIYNQRLRDDLNNVIVDQDPMW